MKFIRWAAAATVAAVLPAAIAAAATDPGFTDFKGPILRQGYSANGDFIVSSTLVFSSTERSSVALVVDAESKDGAQLFLSPILDRVVHRDLKCPHYIKTDYRIAKSKIAKLKLQKGLTVSSSFSVSVTDHEVRSGHAKTKLNLAAGKYQRVVVPPCP